MKVWLDDVRPAPLGWTLCRTVAEALLALAGGDVVEASLDHDLDVCPECHAEMPPPGEVLLPCKHKHTGMEVVKWMRRTGVWPREKPKVHSSNEDAAAVMRDLIDAYWRPRGDLFTAPKHTCWVSGSTDADELIGFWRAEDAARAFAHGRWRVAGKPESQFVQVMDETGIETAFLVGGNPDGGFVVVRQS